MSLLFSNRRPLVDLYNLTRSSIQTMQEWQWDICAFFVNRPRNEQITDQLRINWQTIGHALLSTHMGVDNLSVCQCSGSTLSTVIDWSNLILHWQINVNGRRQSSIDYWGLIMVPGQEANNMQWFREIFSPFLHNNCMFNVLIRIASRRRF